MSYRIEKKSALSDPIVSDVSDMHKDLINLFTTWNANHFKDKLNIQVLSPGEFLKVQKTGLITAIKQIRGKGPKCMK